MKGPYAESGGGKGSANSGGGPSGGGGGGSGQVAAPGGTSAGCAEGLAVPRVAAQAVAAAAKAVPEPDAAAATGGGWFMDWYKVAACNAPAAGSVATSDRLGRGCKKCK